MDEPDLIERAANGDVDAFTALVESRRERVFWIAYNLVGDRELARDVAQEVFLRLYRVIGRFRKGGRFDPWLYRITVHLGLDTLRRERRHRQAAPLEAAAQMPDETIPSGLEGLGRDEIRRIFTRLSERLGRKQRTAFVLREIEGLPTAAVAEIMETTESTVRNHVQQARRALQKALQKDFPEYFRNRGKG